MMTSLACAPGVFSAGSTRTPAPLSQDRIPWPRALFLLGLHPQTDETVKRMLLSCEEIVPRIPFTISRSTCPATAIFATRSLMTIVATCSHAGLAPLEPQRLVPCHQHIFLQWRSMLRAPGRSLRIAHALAPSARQVTRVPSDHTMKGVAKLGFVGTRHCIIERVTATVQCIGAARAKSACCGWRRCRMCSRSAVPQQATLACRRFCQPSRTPVAT